MRAAAEQEELDSLKILFAHGADFIHAGVRHGIPSFILNVKRFFVR